MQNDKKKKVIIIIGIVLLLIILGFIFFFGKKSAPVDSSYGQSQLLSDLAGLAPRDTAPQDANRLVAPIITVSADVPTVSPGQTSVISWTSPNATSCADGNGNPIELSGSLSVAPKQSYTLEVVCNNSKGTSIESITVSVTTAPIITLSAYPEAVRVGESTFISWATTNTTRCVDGSGKTLRLSDSFSIKLTKPYTFDISCSGPNGTGKNSITVGISPVKVFTKTTTTTAPKTSTSITTTIPTTTPSSTTSNNTSTTNTSGTTQTTPKKTSTGTGTTLTVSTNKTILKAGESATVSWTSTGATSCIATTPTGVEVINAKGITFSFYPGLSIPNFPTVGSFQIRVLAGHPKATIIITCIGTSGSTTDEITVFADATTLVSGPPTISLSATPETVPGAGQLSYISWNTTNATECTGGAGTDTWAEWFEPVNNIWSNIHSLQVGLGVSGSARVSPGLADPSPIIPVQTNTCNNSGDGGFCFNFPPAVSQSTTFTVGCKGPLGTASKAVTVTVVPPASGDCGSLISCVLDFFGW